MKLLEWRRWEQNYHQASIILYSKATAAISFGAIYCRMVVGPPFEAFLHSVCSVIDIFNFLRVIPVDTFGGLGTHMQKRLLAGLTIFFGFYLCLSYTVRANVHSTAGCPALVTIVGCGRSHQVEQRPVKSAVSYGSRSFPRVWHTVGSWLIDFPCSFGRRHLTSMLGLSINVLK